MRALSIKPVLRRPAHFLASQVDIGSRETRQDRLNPVAFGPEPKDYLFRLLSGG